MIYILRASSEAFCWLSTDWLIVEFASVIMIIQGILDSQWSLLTIYPCISLFHIFKLYVFIFFYVLNITVVIFLCPRLWLNSIIRNTSMRGAYLDWFSSSLDISLWWGVGRNICRSSRTPVFAWFFFQHHRSTDIMKCVADHGNMLELTLNKHCAAATMSTSTASARSRNKNSVTQQFNHPIRLV